MGSQIGFLAGSVLCGISWDVQSLIFFRVLQGLAGGLLVPLFNELSLCKHATREPRHRHGSFRSSHAIGSSYWPTLGGYLVISGVGVWSFYINVLS